jgi:hypothetical protein
MFCDDCGAQISEQVDICPTCGFEVSKHREKETSPKSVLKPGIVYAKTSPYSTGQYGQLKSPTSKNGTSSNYSRRKTGWLNYVLIMNWFRIIGMVILAFVCFSADTEEKLDGAIITIEAFQTTGFILLLMAVLTLWLTVKLADFSNIARIIDLFLIIITLIGTVLVFGNSIIIIIFTFILLGLEFFALVLHADTVRPFRRPGLKFYKRKTGWLNYVLVMNWFRIIIVVILAFVCLSADTEEKLDGVNMTIEAYQTTGFILLLIAVFNLWVTVQLAEFSNMARIIDLLLIIITLIVTLIFFGNSIIIVTSTFSLLGLEIYVIITQADIR